MAALFDPVAIATNWAPSVAIDDQFAVAGIVLAVHDVPFVDVAAAVPNATTQNTAAAGFHDTLCHKVELGNVLAVHDAPDAEVEEAAAVPL